MFCSKCGNELQTDARFCSKCGQPVAQTSTDNVSQNNSGNYTLTINRAKQWFLVNPPVKIIIDEKAEYKIDNGETIRIPVSTGTHMVAFSCSIRNKIVNINVTNNVILNIKWNRVTGSLEVE